jgi:hypothetical protein
MHLAARAGAHRIVKILIEHSTRLIVIVQALTLPETGDEGAKGKQQSKLMLAKDPEQFAKAFARFGTMIIRS